MLTECCEWNKRAIGVVPFIVRHNHFYLVWLGEKRSYLRCFCRFKILCAIGFITV